MTSPTILVIPDAHAKPDVSNRRFDWLGQYIMDQRPDVIVCLGDFADMESLCSYDKGKKSFEGRRYKHDIAVAIDAQGRLFAPMREYNKQQRATKHKQYKPHTIMCIGNHEVRINRVAELQPELDGVVSLEDLKYEKYWDEVCPFLSTVLMHDIAFCHYFTSGVMGRPLGGEHPAASMLSKHYVSCIAGHSHLRDFAERTRADGTKLCGLVAGCYLDPEQREDYAGPANDLWWRGVVMLRNVKNGGFDPEFVSIETLMEKYDV